MIHVMKMRILFLHVVIFLFVTACSTEQNIIDAFKKYYKIDDKEYRALIASKIELEEEEIKVEEIEDYGKLLSDAVDEFGIKYDDDIEQQEELYSAADTPIVKLVQSIITKAI